MSAATVRVTAVAASQIRMPTSSVSDETGSDTWTRSYTDCHAGGVPRGALSQRPQSRAEHAVQVVAEPLHGLRASLHVLLRARLRAARRSPRGGGIRPLGAREDQCGRGPAPRAGA